MQLRMQREAQVEARSLIDATEAALAADGKALLSPPERAAIARLIYALADIIETGNDSTDGATDGAVRALKLATAALNAATQDFAARRMDASVQRAFAGQRVDLLEGI
jgi:molecular chaperone HscA